MAEVYRKRVAGLQEALNGPGADVDAAEAVRSLVEKVVLVPVDGKLVIDLYGEIGTILKLAMAKKGSDILGPVSEQLVMVAGACNRVRYSSGHGSSWRVPCGGEFEDRHQLAA
jgi:hypothetical protein